MNILCKIELTHISTTSNLFHQPKEQVEVGWGKQTITSSCNFCFPAGIPISSWSLTLITETLKNTRNMKLRGQFSHKYFCSSWWQCFWWWSHKCSQVFLNFQEDGEERRSFSDKFTHYHITMSQTPGDFQNNATRRKAKVDMSVLCLSVTKFLGLSFKSCNKFVNFINL